MALHTILAKGFVEQTAASSPLSGGSDEIRNLIGALEHVVSSWKPSTNALHDISFPYAKTLQRPSLRGCELPPIEQVVSLMQDPKCKCIDNPDYPNNSISHAYISYDW